MDRLEQVIAMILYIYLVARMWPAYVTAGAVMSYLLIISEGAVIVFLLLRKPTTNISMRVQDWLSGVAGTCLGLCVTHSDKVAPISLAAAAAFMVTGMVTHIGAKISLNSSFGLVAANRGVKASGMYRLVRHPMYAGYMLSHIGFLLAQPMVYNVVVYAVSWTLLVTRIVAEERVLMLDPEYQALAKRTKWRLFPGVY